MKILSLILAFVAVMCLGQAHAQTQELSGLARIDTGASTVTDREGGVDVRLALSQAVPYRVFFLDEPARLVVDFREVDFGPGPASVIDKSDGFVSVTWGKFRPGWSRMVAELAGPMELISAAEKTSDDGSAELLLSLRPTDAAAFASTAKTPKAADWALPEPTPSETPRKRQTGDRPLFIVLDPGHGGIDPGAEAGGLKEADIVLTFAKELKDKLARAGVDVLLTREEDVFVPLETRISVARAAGADLFLSLHADALEEGSATGATAYILADEAEDRASTLLAEKHDRADLLAGVDLTGHDDEVANVLMDLARTETDPRSSRLALALQTAISSEGLKMHRHPVQGAAFSVLKAPDIPSVLLELGFLSSEADRKRLSDPEWRERMQKAIVAAIQAWGIADAAEARLIRQ